MSSGANRETRMEMLLESVLLAVTAPSQAEVSRAVLTCSRDELVAVVERLAKRINDTSSVEVGAFGPGATCAFVIDTAAREFAVTGEEIRSDSRLRAVSDARAVAMYVARQAGLTFADIGLGFDKDRTGVMYAVNKTAANPRLLIAAEKIAASLGESLANPYDPPQERRRGSRSGRHLHVVLDPPRLSLVEPEVPISAPQARGSVFEQAVEFAAHTFLIEPAQLLSEDRTRRVSDARAVAMGVLRLEGMTLPAIARPFGRDHTTVLASLRRVEGTAALAEYAQQIHARLIRPATGSGVREQLVPGESLVGDPAPAKPRSLGVQPPSPSRPTLVP